jgi:hypothetical protein
MAYFDINIFGTLHTYHNPNLFTFNLHVLQVESDIVPTNFDMFIEFYAFPFNFGGGVGSVLTANYIDPAQPNQTPSLNNRFSVGKPQVIHLTALTPSTVIDLYDCNSGQYPNFGLCTINQTNTFFPLPTPCPNPEDIRLFSGTFSVPYKNNGLDSDWTDIINPASGNRNLTPSVSPNFTLPLNITIIADGCRYLNKRSSANIYTNYNYNYQTDPQPYGNVDCLNNPKFYEIGYKDKIRVT